VKNLNYLPLAVYQTEKEWVIRPKAQPAKPKSVKIPVTGGPGSGNGESKRLDTIGTSHLKK
jgi:hypothetical protein